MLTPSDLESAASVAGRTFVRRPDSTWAIADQLSPQWNDRASLVQPSRSRAARTRQPIPPLSLMSRFIESGALLGRLLRVRRWALSLIIQLSVSSDSPGPHDRNQDPRGIRPPERQTSRQGAARC